MHLKVSNAFWQTAEENPNRVNDIRKPLDNSSETVNTVNDLKEVVKNMPIDTCMYPHLLVLS